MLSIYHACRAAVIKAIVSTPNTWIRYTMWTRRYYRITPILSTLNWLPVKFQIDYNKYFCWIINPWMLLYCTSSGSWWSAMAISIKWCRFFVVNTNIEGYITGQSFLLQSLTVIEQPSIQCLGLRHIKDTLKSLIKDSVLKPRLETYLFSQSFY